MEMIEALLGYTQSNEVVRILFTNIQLLLWGLILVVLVIDAVTVAVKTGRTEEREEGK